MRLVRCRRGPWIPTGLVVIGAIALAGSVRGEEVPLTLAEALAAADRQNPELIAARERVLAQEARAEAVRASRLPKLTVSSGWSRTDNPSYVFAHKLNASEFTEADFAISRLNAPGSISHLSTTVGVEASLDVFGKIRDAAQVQASAWCAASAATREATLDVRLRVIEAYRSAALSRRAVEVTEGALAGARAREADVEARVAEGASLRADLLRSRARRRQREADLAQGRGDAVVAALALSRLLGAEPGTLFRPTDAPGVPPPLVGSESDWTARGLLERPAIRAAAERVEAMRRAARLEGRSLLPDLLAYGHLQDDRNGFSGSGQSYVVGASVRWSAFDPGRKRRGAAALADLRAAEQDARAASDQVRLEAASAYRRAEAAREQWAAASGGAEDAREALRVVQERRRAGLATLTDELETEAASLGAELMELRAAAGAALADAALDRAVGDAGTSAGQGSACGPQ
jgi:outer membrane protein TolC